MKIEKLTENKIRVIVNPKDLDETHTDIQSLMTKAIETQGLFFEMLERAEKEVGFYTEGCKLLIEAFSSPDDILVFTITKSERKDTKTSTDTNKKKLLVKRKLPCFSNTEAIYRFDSFEQFCEFVTLFHILLILIVKKCQKTFLYTYTKIHIIWLLII